MILASTNSNVVDIKTGMQERFHNLSRKLVPRKDIFINTVSTLCPALNKRGPVLNSERIVKKKKKKNVKREALAAAYLIFIFSADLLPQLQKANMM